MALHEPIAKKTRAERLAELTSESADSITQALAAGLPNMMTLIDEAVGNYLQDEQARAELLKKTAAGGNPFTKVLADLVWHEAEQFAEAELQRLEREGADADDEARVDRAICRRETA